MRVGIFDSGIGGLTVLKRMYNMYPNNEYIYLGDTLNLPYGNKSKEELCELAINDIDFLIDNGAEIIIIACGTVSSNCIDYLKNKYKLPIYDIISPVIRYLNNSDYSNIGVIATNATIDSGVFRNNVSKNIYEIKTPDFVPLIEDNKFNELDNSIDNYLSWYRDKIDLLVLGCTHYPIIRDNIEKYFGNNTRVLDMSELLLDVISDGNNSDIAIYYSKLSNNVIENTKKIMGIDNIKILEKE